MSHYMRWHQQQHAASTRIGVTILLGPLFLGVLPFAVGTIGSWIDHRLGLSPRRTGSPSRLVGAVLTAAGFSLGWWSVASQLDRGRGTPLPMMPTQELVTDGPYAYCRNPMTLGAIVAYLGVAIAAGTAAGTAMVFAFAASLLVYLKRLEEGELAARFGGPYLAYRRETPFLVPRLPRLTRRVRSGHAEPPPAG